MNKAWIFVVAVFALLVGAWFALVPTQESSESLDVPIQVLNEQTGAVEKVLILEEPEYKNKDLDVAFKDKDTKEKVLDFNLKSHPNVTYVRSIGFGEIDEKKVNPSLVAMYYDVHSKYKLQDSLGEPLFTDMETGKVVERDYRYVYQTTEEYEVPTYSCEPMTATNGTWIENCQQKGTETKTREIWLPLSDRNIPKGDIRIGIEVASKQGDWIDGIWKIGGEEIDKHAEWASNLDTNLEAFYSFDTGVGTTAYDSLNVMNLTAVSSATWSTDGLINNASNSTQGYWSSSYPGGLNLTFPYTISFWVKTSATPNGMQVASKKAGGLYPWWFRYDSAAPNSIEYLSYDSSPTPQIIDGNITITSAGYHHIFVTADGTNNKMWIDNKYAGSVAQSTLHYGADSNFSIGARGDGGTTANSLIDAAGFWSRELTGAERAQLYNSGAGIQYQDAVPSSLSVSVLEPANNSVFTTHLVNLTTNITRTDADIGIVNTSVEVRFSNGSIAVKETNSSSFLGNYTWNLVLPNGNDYNWTAYSWANNSVRYNVSLNENRYFNVSLADPSVTLVSPSDGTLVSNIYVEFNSTGTGNSYNIDNATLFLWFGNGTLYATKTNTSVSGTGTSFALINQSLDGFASYLWNVQYCGSSALGFSCSFAASNNSLTFSPFSVNSVSYNASVLETTHQFFTLNISANPLVSSVVGTLVYNGSSLATNIENPSSGIYISSTDFDIPLATTDSDNKTLQWRFNVTLTDSSVVQQNSSIYGQQVNKTHIFLCNSTYQEPLVNFTTKSAENPFPNVNATFKSTFEWFMGNGAGGVVRNLSYENLTEISYEFDFCTDTYTTPFVTTADLEYDAQDYALNFYFLRNASFTNTEQEINLHLLNSSKATATTLKVRGDAQRPVEDALIQIQLYDIGTGTYQTIAMAETNFDGEDIVYLNWLESLYKFIISRDGVVEISTQPYKIGETPQIFDITTETTYSFSKFEDFQYSLSYNNVTSNFILTYTKPSGEVDEACLRVNRRTAQNDTQICLTCESSSSATLFCNIANQGNGTYVAAFYATGSADLVDWISQTIGGSFAQEVYDAIGVEDATAYAIFFGVLVFAFFLITPVLGVLGLILGLFGAAALGFAPMDYLTYVAIAIMGGIMIWILKR